MKIRVLKKNETTTLGPTMALRIKNSSSETPQINVKEIDEEILIIIQRIFKLYPYIGLPYMYLGRAYRDKGTAAISANGWLVVNPKWWTKITPEEKYFVIIHEILHGMLKHPIRAPAAYSREFNIIADAIVNSFALRTLPEIALNSHFNNTYTVDESKVEEIKRKIEKLSMRNLVDWDTIRRLFKERDIEPPQDLEKLSADEIFTRLYHGIIKNQKQCQALQKNNNENNDNGNSGASNMNMPAGSSGGGGSCKKNQQGGSSGGGSSDQNQNQGQNQRQGGGGGGRRQRRYGGRNSIRNDRGQGQGQNQGQNQKQNGGGGGVDTSNEDYENGPLGGDLIQNYDPEKDNAQVTKNPNPIFNNANNSESAENAWRRIHNDAVNFQRLANIRNKQAGAGAGAIEELIELIEGESKITWQKIIKETVREHYRGFTDRSYKREDRRYSAMKSLRDRDDKIYFPGIVRYNIPDIHVTFDTSGSMSEEELTQILVEVYTIAKKFRTKIRVTQWDWDVQDDRIVRNPSEFKVFSVRGRGGTSIIPVLQYVSGERDFNGKRYDLQKDSIFIVFSDFELFDDPEEVFEYLQKIETSKRTRFLFVNTKTFNVFDSKKLGLRYAFEKALKDQ